MQVSSPKRPNFPTTDPSAAIYLSHPSIDKMLDHTRVFFVSEGKAPAERMKERVPHTVLEMYACAKRLKSVLDSLIQWPL